MASPAKSGNALVVVSIGNRPWFALSRKWMQRYCAKYHLEFVVIDSPNPMMPGLQEFDRPQNWGRATKLGILDLFNSYNRILLLDDTCFVSPLTENLFDVVPEPAIGCFVEGKYRDKERFTEYLDFISALYGAKSPPDRNNFFNAGVCVFSSCHSDLFRITASDWAAIAKDRTFPCQGYLCCRVGDYGIPLHDIGIAYNMLGSRIKAAGGVLRCPEQTRIFHLTSALGPDERLSSAYQLDAHFELQSTSA